MCLFQYYVNQLLSQKYFSLCIKLHAYLKNIFNFS